MLVPNWSKCVLSVEKRIRFGTIVILICSDEILLEYSVFIEKDLDRNRGDTTRNEKSLDRNEKDLDLTFRVTDVTFKNDVIAFNLIDTLFSFEVALAEKALQVSR